ncbi:MAG: glycosyltransferase family 4 protein [Candidatus Omnitrophica bacterium]|nr:glycosyltransferase family 4 protein [Candidatus Omnitrophota bacterium]
MKILLLTTHLNLGGIGMYVLLLAKGLANKGHRVLVASSGGELADSLASCSVEHVKINVKTKSEVNPKLLAVLSRLTKIVLENKIDMLHAHTRVTQVLAQLLSQKTKVPYVTTCHGFFKPRAFRKAFPCWGRHCIAISEAVREHLVNDLKVKKECVSVVHNGVEIERFSREKVDQEQKGRFKKDFGLDGGAVVIGTIARLSSIKGQCYLISAMKLILEQEPKARLLLVGDGPEKERLLAQVKELGIESSVSFSPSTFDTSIPLSCMDVFVFPSLLEGLGLAIIEAQAMGLPIVASDVGGVYTLVKDGINGFLVRPQEPQGIADAVLKLIRDKELAKRFGQQGKHQVEESFNLSQMVDGIEQVYERMVAK